MCNKGTNIIFIEDNIIFIEYRVNSFIKLDEFVLDVSPGNEHFYNLLMVLGSLSPLKIKILLLLAHLYPKRINATELTLLLGYSKNSRIIYRGVLDELQQEQLISIDKISSKKFSIQLDINNPITINLSELCIEFGEDYSRNLINFLEGS